MSRFKEHAPAVIEENRKSLLDMEDSEVQVFGMGRMKCAVRAFVMRLVHMAACRFHREAPRADQPGESV